MSEEYDDYRDAEVTECWTENPTTEEEIRLHRQSRSQLTASIRADQLRRRQNSKDSP